MTVPCLRDAALLTTLLLAAPVVDATAQSSAWSDLSVPQGVVSTSLRGQGKLVSYLDSYSLDIFSAVTRRWHNSSIVPGAALRLFNDCAIVTAPNLCRAFSSHTGQFQDLAAPGPYAVINATSHKNDSIILVTSGNQLHAFSAFTGQWSSRAVSPNYGADVQRHVAVLYDGATIAAFSAFAGQWRDNPCPIPPTSISADGTAGFASNTSDTYAFSAHTLTWLTTPSLNNATFVRGDDWGLWYRNGAVLAYSGLRSKYARSSQQATAIAGSSDLYALLTTPTGLCAYSAVTGDMLPIAKAPNSIELGGATALLHFDKSVVGYSALRQQAATLLSQSAASDTGNLVANVTAPSGQNYAWSSITASWYAAPSASNGAIPMLTETTVGLQSATDCYAFAARTGQFVARGNPVTMLAANPSSAPLLGYDANHLVAFDTDGERWLSTPRTDVSTPTFAVWRTSAVALDGATAHGFGAQTGTWQQHALAPGIALATANSEVAYVTQATQVSACSMLGEIVSYQQFPHFRRVQPRGVPISFAAAPPATALAVAAFAPPSIPVVVPGLGELMLDSNVAILAPIFPTPSRPVSTITLQLPGAAILAGTSIASQLLVLPTSAPAYLSDRATVQLW